MDELNYTYSGNKLTTVQDDIAGDHEVDFVPRGNNGYTYWPNGNLKSDANENIENIAYNSYLNQPENLLLSDKRSISSTYDGSGSLIKNTYSTGETWEYAGPVIYKNGLQYQMNTPDGRATFINNTWQYEFDYKDHLGNTRTSFKAENSALVKTAETAFDPWGVVLNSIGTQNGVQNRWELQGKEKELSFGLNRVSFGARTFNPTIARWDGVDMMASKYHSFSPFNYVLNSPLLLKDPDGKEIILFYADYKYDNKKGYHYKNGVISQKTANSLNAILNTSEGYDYFAQFAKKGQKIAGHTFNKDGEFSNINLNIVDYSLSKDDSEGWASPLIVDGWLTTRTTENKIDISLSIHSFSKSENHIVETISHEIGLHGFKSKFLIRAFEEGGIKALNRIVNKLPSESEDHTAVKNNSKTHLGNKSYRKIEKQLEQIYKNRFKSTFIYEQKLYKNKY